MFQGRKAQMKYKTHKSYTNKQILMFGCWFGGMIALSILFLIEIPSIIKEGNGWILVIVLPVLFIINKIFVQRVILEWRKK